MAEDPSWMPQPSDFEQFFGVQHLSDHLSSIVDGLDEYYHCRHTDCGCITTNSTWSSAVAAGGGQYWCPDPKLNCMRKYRAYPQMYAGQKLMESKKVMVFKDPYKEKGLTYQYCSWGSVPDELLKEDIKSIFNDIQLVIQDQGWIKAHGIVLELGKKQFQESWDHCAEHLKDGFHYICKPQWQGG